MKDMKPISRFVDIEPPTTIQEKFGVAIGDASRAWRDKLTQRLKPLGLSQSRWTALLYLSRVPGGLTQSELARMLGIEAPTLTRLLKQLEENGWITRSAPPEDGRIKMVQLTPKAKRVVVRINAAIAELRAQTVGKLSDQQAAEGFAALHAFQQLLDQAE
jgi:MarR family transcriptional regulator, transcriptional regulator for hemolysin